jgi:hypothetical protein
MPVMVIVRTGRSIPHSAARLPIMPAARLPQRHPAPQIARQLPHLLRQRHRLIQVRQKVA